MNEVDKYGADMDYDRRLGRTSVGSCISGKASWRRHDMGCTASLWSLLRLRGPRESRAQEAWPILVEVQRSCCRPELDVNFNIQWDREQDWRALRCVTEERSQGREVSGRKTGARAQNLSSSWFWSGADPRRGGGKSSQLQEKISGSAHPEGPLVIPGEGGWGLAPSFARSPVRASVGPRALGRPARGKVRHPTQPGRDWVLNRHTDLC